jgi:hypothetical protein
VRPAVLLEREEYVEQAYFFNALGVRIGAAVATQDLMISIREEILATTKLPMAIDFLVAELKLSGVMSPAMARLGHYFTPFQAFVIGEAERAKGKFDFFVALQILAKEARYRADGCTPQGIFLYQFETISRTRLGYHHGLDAVSRDPLFDEPWKEWILTVRSQVGLVDFADLVYVRSALYAKDRQRQGDEPEKPTLFGEKEGRIALAHRKKDPLWLFAALERHLNYPTVPRLKPADESQQMIPNLLRRMERVEQRLKLLEEESRGGIDLSRFMPPPTQ